MYGIETYCMNTVKATQIARFMGPTWGPPGSCRSQMGPMWAPWTLLSGKYNVLYSPLLTPLNGKQWYGHISPHRTNISPVYVCITVRSRYIMVSFVQITHTHSLPTRTRYGCLSWVRSVIKRLPSKLFCCGQQNVILYRDISRVQNWLTAHSRRGLVIYTKRKCQPAIN